MIFFLNIFNIFLSFLIIYFAIKVYASYRKKYLKFFILSLLLIPLIFIYSIFEFAHSLPIEWIIVYPSFMLIVELTIIIGQKILISSIKSEGEEEYKILLREDVAMLRSFQKLSNYLIGKISPLIGIESIKNILDETTSLYPSLVGSYIGMDEKLQIKTIEENIDKIEKENIAEGFLYLITKLIEIYSTFVPYEKIIEEIRDEIEKIDKKVVKWFIPFAFFKLVMEPLIRNCSMDEIREIRISVDIEGIKINKKGEIIFHKIYSFGENEREDKYIDFLDKCYPIFFKIYGRNADKKLTENFRKLPSNIKEEMYRYDFIKKLPEKILEEEKITLISREKSLEELIERQKKLEEAYKRLSEAKLDKMKSTFIDTMAHELKTPLTAIKTYNDLLSKEKLGKLTKSQKEILEKMSKNIDRLIKIIDDMLHIPSVEMQDLELRKEKFYFKEIIENIISELEETIKDKKQKVHIDIGKLYAKGDKKLIEKAIKNVISNAVKYTPPKGSIFVRGFKEGNYAHLIIEDTGSGIPGEELEKIFEPFYRGKNGGAGLGLAIAKNIVEAHGGRVWAESEIGKGARFHIVLGCI
ncbi:MAG: HAMP domain-containing histidine kinase [Thermoplasmatales archaeon]|nr:HAMP domain-containing histidine kinase [Thermoplasmatales archaeon]